MKLIFTIVWRLRTYNHLPVDPNYNLRIHRTFWFYNDRVARRGERTDGEKDCTCLYCIGEDTSNQARVRS